MSSPEDHSCEEVLNRVYLCLDGEMSPAEEKEFLKEIDNCSCCLEKYNIERSFKEFLSARIERKSVAPSLIEDIRSQISSYA